MQINMAGSTIGLAEAFEKACQTFSGSKLYSEQKQSLKAFVTLVNSVPNSYRLFTCEVQSASKTFCCQYFPF